MTGTIAHTHRNGGAIAASDHSKALIPFDWQDCEGIGPGTVGHGVRIDYCVEVVGNRERAIAVKRANVK
jgi:hypothetical protein